jgi:fluoride exporter
VTWLLVAVGAAVGAPTRYLADRAVQRRHLTIYPWGTWVVNVAGCFVLGAVVQASAASGPWSALLGTGFCGALTTYSTFGYETLRLLEKHDARDAWFYALASAAAGLAAATAGWWAAAAL